jgi:Predicted oxidoreductases (related to aryl-alcohol dehydrogenases)
VERIDLFQLHRVDPTVPADEQFGLLGALQAEGKVGAVGLSEVGVEEIERARRVVDVVTVQNRYNLVDRASDDVLRYCTEQGIGFLPWFPIASGRLAEPGGPVAEIAERLGATASQVALAWLLRRSSVMLPIPGTSSLAHVEENTRAAELELDPESVEKLDAAA